MKNDSQEERLAQLEKIVATQSDMLLKLVEMMNHLGTENATLSERIDKSRAETTQQLEKIATLVQGLALQFGGD